MNRILDDRLPLAMARFGTPLALGMGLQTTFNLVDAWLIGQLPSDVAGPALGAIGIADQLAALGSIVSYGLSTASATLLSRLRGAGDEEGVRRVAWQSILVIGALSLLVASLGLFGAGPLLRGVVGAKGRVADLGVSYLRVMLGGSGTIFFLLHLTAIQRALGSSKTPVALLVGSNVLNLFLALLLVFGSGPAPTGFAWVSQVASALGAPRLELMGAAWATVFARLVVLVPLTIVVARRFGVLRAMARPDALIARRILSLGWPSSAELVVRIGAMLLTHSIVARWFTTEHDQSATTALGVVFRLETMALFVGLGWGSAAQTFMGQNLGAKRERRARASGWWAAAFAALFMLGVALAYRVYGAELVAVFDRDPAVTAVSLAYLRVVGPTYVALGTGIVLGAAMQGAGATGLTLALDSAVVVLVQIPLSVWASAGPSGSLDRLWWAIAITYVCFAVVAAIAYQRGTFLRRAQRLGEGV